MSTNKKVTVKTMAKMLGVTHSTVCKALKGSTDISAATQKKVRELAESLGYRPNVSARSLSQRKSYTIGAIIPEIVSTFHSHVVNGFYKAADSLGYEVIIMVSNESAKFENKHLSFLAALPVDGILISVTQETTDPRILKEINENKGIPIVFFGRALEDLHYTTVTSNQIKSMFLIIDHLIDIGRKKIAFLGPKDRPLPGKLRYEGYLQGLKKHNIIPNDNYFVPCQIDPQCGYQAMKKLLQLKNIPNAVICMNDYVALGAKRAIFEAKLSIPEDIAIAGFGNVVETSAFTIPITSIEQYPRTIGIRAMEEIITEIENKNVPYQPKEILLNTKLVIRESTVTNPDYQRWVSEPEFGEN